MKKTVMNLAIASCFAFGISLAQASAHEHGDAHGAAAVHSDYFGKADITGQAQNIKVDAKGVRLPYNMAQDMPSVGDREHGVRQVYGQADVYYAKPNEAKPKVESNNYWCMIGTNNPSGSCSNHSQSAYGRGYTGR